MYRRVRRSPFGQHDVQAQLLRGYKIASQGTPTLVAFGNAPIQFGNLPAHAALEFEARLEVQRASSGAWKNAPNDLKGQARRVERADAAHHLECRIAIDAIAGGLLAGAQQPLAFRTGPRQGMSRHLVRDAPLP